MAVWLRFIDSTLQEFFHPWAITCGRRQLGLEFNKERAVVVGQIRWRSYTGRYLYFSFVHKIYGT